MKVGVLLFVLLVNLPASWAFNRGESKVNEFGLHFFNITKGNRDKEGPCSAAWWSSAAQKKILSISNVNKRCSSTGERIIHVALSSPDLKPLWLDTLLSQGADVSAHTTNGITPLHIAVGHQKNPRIFELLISYSADVNAIYKGWSVLHMAMATQLDVAVIKMLIDAGVIINKRGPDLRTPLHIASALQKNLKIIELLLDFGADINARTAKGATPLHFVSRFQTDINFYILLLSRNAKVNISSDTGWTPLHVALQYQKGKSVPELFIKSGAKVNVATNEGWTPLHIAATYRDEAEVFTLLLAVKADTKAVGGVNRLTPLEVLKMRGGRQELISLLASATSSKK